MFRQWSWRFPPSAFFVLVGWLVGMLVGWQVKACWETKQQAFAVRDLQSRTYYCRFEEIMCWYMLRWICHPPHTLPFGICNPEHFNVIFKHAICLWYQRSGSTALPHFYGASVGWCIYPIAICSYLSRQSSSLPARERVADIRLGDHDQSCALDGESYAK